jgi:hypothetical protein
MFSADVIVIEHARLFLCQHDNSSGAIGKSLKHGSGLSFG